MPKHTSIFSRRWGPHLKVSVDCPLDSDGSPAKETDKYQSHADQPMQSDDTIIPVYDTAGNIIDRKRRDQIDRQQDIIKSAMVMLINPQGQCYVVQPVQTAYPGKWLTSAATMVREGEAPDKAIKRCLESELGITSDPTPLGKKFADMDGVRRFLHMYYLRTSEQPRHNPQDSSQTRWVEQTYIRMAVNEFAPPVHHLMNELMTKLG